MFQPLWVSCIMECCNGMIPFLYFQQGSEESEEEEEEELTEEELKQTEVYKLLMNDFAIIAKKKKITVLVSVCEHS